MRLFTGNQNSCVKTRILMCFWGIFLLYCIAVSMRKMPKRIVKILEQFGKMSYELYLTHVAIRALMNGKRLVFG